MRNVLLFGTCAYFGKWRISHLTYSLYCIESSIRMDFWLILCALLLSRLIISTFLIIRTPKMYSFGEEEDFAKINSLYFSSFKTHFLLFLKNFWSSFSGINSRATISSSSLLATIFLLTTLGISDIDTV